MPASTPFGDSESVFTLNWRSAAGHLTIEPAATLSAPSPVTPGPAQPGLALDQMPLTGLEPGSILLSQPVSPDASGTNGGGTSGGGTTLTQTALAAPSATHITINATFDASVTLDSAIAASYESAANAAIQYFESLITTNVTVDIDFGWGEVGGSTIQAGALGESLSSILGFSYGQVYKAVQALTGQSAVQQAAYATLPSRDPTGRATFDVTTAQAAALGLQSNTGQLDGSIGLDSNSPFFWSQSTPQAGSYDAVSTFEHEISEVLGRQDMGGVGNTNGSGGTYTLLDMFRYTAADLGSADAPGSAAGAIDQPFVAGYSASNYSYFSYNGQAITLGYDTPSDVAAGYDIADWSPSAPSDSFGAGFTGAVQPVSATDVQELNVIGYSLAAACYAAGTRIATSLGEAPIEALQVGDEVRLAGGGTAPVVWLGRRRLDMARHSRPETVWPVRVRAGAFSDGVPARDLLLSPDHAVLAGGLLIPIRCLINGATVAQEGRDHITYWHVELPRHAAILAEGLAAESYLDTGNRAAFDNAGNIVQAHPDFTGRAEAAWRVGAFAPQVTHGEALKIVRQRLLARAASLGWQRAEACPVLRAAGRVLRGQTAGDELRFMLPPGTEEVVLTSEASVPRDFGEGEDARRLGVAVASITLDSAAVALGDARFGTGWHEAEPAWRWSDGAGVIRVGGARLMTLRVAVVARYWVAPEAARRAAG